VVNAMIISVEMTKNRTILPITWNLKICSVVLLLI